MRPDSLGDADGGAEARQRAALLDMQLDIRPDAGSSSSSGPSASGSRPAARIASTRLIPSWSRSSLAAAGSTAPVSSRLPRHATPNLAPSSSMNAATAIGRAGWNPAPRRSLIAANADTTPSGPSNAPPSGTESRWLPVTTACATAARASPPRPQVAVAVAVGTKAQPGRGPGEPAPAGGIGLSPRVPPVAAGQLFPPDPGQLGPHVSERHLRSPPRPRPRLSSRPVPRLLGATPASGRGHRARLRPRCPLIAGVGVPDHAHAGSLVSTRSSFCPASGGAVGDAHLASVDGAADAHAAAVVDAHPGRPGRRC